jgi:hypothetical protein
MPQGAAGHRPGRAARAAAGATNRHPGGSRGRPGPGPITSPLAAALLALGPSPAATRPQPRDQGPDRRAGPAHRHRSPQLVTLWASAKTTPARCWSLPGTTPSGSAARPALPCWVVLTDPGVLWQDCPAPPQPGGTARQRCAVPDRAGAAGLPPADQGRPDPSAGRGQAQQRNHPLSQARHRPGSLRSAPTPTPRVPHPTHLTDTSVAQDGRDLAGRFLACRPQPQAPHQPTRHPSRPPSAALMDGRLRWLCRLPPGSCGMPRCPPSPGSKGRADRPARQSSRAGP